ncbi:MULTISPECIES: porin [unclassified Roseitalea]|uniref:porin n=1 Tax=unclassified Roseitalea TaxID=2639107 RepID=UPI00273D2417|nr:MULTISPECIES: porin [unclassified Roseitalea]
MGARGAAGLVAVLGIGQLWVPVVAPALADRPPQLIAEPSPTRAVEPCLQFGPGFVRQPGTGTCLRISGQVEVSQKAGFGQQDLFAETTYVTGEPFIIYDLVPAEDDVGAFETDAIVTFTSATETENGPLLGVLSLRGTLEPESDDTIFVDKAFVQLAGFTAGRLGSFFDFSPGLSYTAGYASNAITDLVAYTHRFGERGSLTVSLEDDAARRAEEGVWALRGSRTLPNLVVAARIDDPRRGAAQLSAALIHLSDDRQTECCGVPEDELGFAVSAGLEYRTKIAGRFGRFIVSGAYAEGGVSYLGGLPFASDYLVDGDGTLVKTRGYSLLASYEHVWRNDLKSTATVSGISLATKANTLEWKPSGILASLGSEYMPAPGLQVGLDGSYYVDIGKADYYGVEGETSRADLFKLTAYARRLF